jgi:Ca-activated chloride channel family protein
MRAAYFKVVVTVLVVALGLGGIAFGIYEQRYVRAVAAGNQAVAEQRFDSQDYERARHFWFARQDVLLFNQGVMAYKAQNLSRAAEHFRQASQRTKSPHLRMHALYNLGMVMLALDEVEGAAELFKEALRLNPLDTDAKFNLERLYQIVLRQEGENGQASLKQAPGSGQGKEEDPQNDGHGRSQPPSGI